MPIGIKCTEHHVEPAMHNGKRGRGDHEKKKKPRDEVGDKGVNGCAISV